MEIFASLENLGFSAITLGLLIVLAVMLSCYVKLVTVLSIVRAGLGANSLPSAFVTTGLALMLSLLVMYPAIQKTTLAIDRELKTENSAERNSYLALNSGLATWKEFLKKHAGVNEVDQFTRVVQDLNSKELVKVEQEELKTSFRVLAPAFLITELKEAFATGLNLFLPFLIIELLIAHLLVGLGMPQLQPSFVSLPFKLLLFVMVDGWTLITTNLISTYAV